MASRRDLIDVALGRKPADLVITNATVMNVLSREFHRADILIKGNRIAAVLSAEERPGGVAPAETLEAEGMVAAPGFIDPHVHIESSMACVGEYARAIIPRGTTTIAADPHEIGNVLGVPGMKLLFEEARQCPLKVMLRVPGRIPAVPEWMETSNAELSVADTRDLFDWPEAVCLAGDINPTLVLDKDTEQLEKFDMARKLGVTISGQSPGLSGRDLAAFICAGPEDSHVAGSIEEVVENTRAGMRSILTLRPGRRLDKNHFAALAALVRDKRLETRLFQFCTDDIHAHDLLNEGHIDHRVRVAIAAGMEPITAYQMATLNVAEGLRIERDHGSIAPGRFADIILLSNVEQVEVAATIIDGKLVYRDGRYLGPRQAPVYPEWACRTVRLSGRLSDADLAVRSPHNGPTARVRAIIAAGRKRMEEIDLPVENGLIVPDAAAGVNAFSMIERHGKNGGVGRGFVKGVDLRFGALASSVNHDAHNIAVFGASYDDMAVAANRLAEIDGGYVLVRDGEVVAELPLPIAGLMSDRPIEEIARKMAMLEEKLVEVLGCPHQEKSFVRLNFLGLPNIPDYGFTDRGLVASGAEMGLLPTVVE